MIGFCLVVIAIGAFNVWTGWHWSKLDHNPWIGKPLGGIFYGMSRPGMVPSRLSVAEINARGRRLVYTAPIGAFAFILFILLRH